VHDVIAVPFLQALERGNHLVGEDWDVV